MMLLLAVIYEIPELNIGFHFYLKNENEDDERMRLRASDTSGPKYTQQVNEVSTAGYPNDQPWAGSNICEAHAVMAMSPAAWTGIKCGTNSKVLMTFGLGFGFGF